MSKTQQWIIFAGRLILGLAFVGSGLAKVADWDGMIKFLASTSIKQSVGGQLLPTVLVALILLETIGGFLLCIGFRTRLAAGLLAVAVLVPLSFFHDFVRVNGSVNMKDYLSFLLDAKVFGGLLFVMCFGPGRYSVDKG